MAIIVETLVHRASRDQADRFDQSIAEAMMQSGGPPAGFMVHLTHPSGDGFVLRNVWRTEEEMTSFYNSVILPKLSEAGLEHDDSVVSPVWGFARP